MAANPGGTGRKQTILIIDDEEVVRMLFQSFLEDEGYHTLLAEDGARGRALLEQHGPAVALVDKNLPDMSGLDLIAGEKSRHPNTEFIMITGYASLDSAVKAMEVGAFSYLTKPFDDMEVVLDRIRAALEVNQLRVETSQLRERLNDLSGGLPAAISTGVSSTSSRLNNQLQQTLSFLETFLNKREQPPPAAAWARTVDMIEDHCRTLRQMLETNRDGRE